jgi:hypothetical protein
LLRTDDQRGAPVVSAFDSVIDIIGGNEAVPRFAIGYRIAGIDQTCAIGTEDREQSLPVVCPRRCDESRSSLTGRGEGLLPG